MYIGEAYMPVQAGRVISIRQGVREGSARGLTSVTSAVCFRLEVPAVHIRLLSVLFDGMPLGQYLHRGLSPFDG